MKKGRRKIKHISILLVWCHSSVWSSPACLKTLKMSPQWWVVSGWSFNFGSTVPLNISLLCWCGGPVFTNGSEVCCAVGKCICQHLSQDAGRTLHSRLPTNLADSRCHPAVKNILGGRRGHTVHHISPRPVLAVPPLCYEAGGSRRRRVSASGCLFVLRLCQLWPHTPKHTQVVVGMGFPNKCRPVCFFFKKTMK